MKKARVPEKHLFLLIDYAKAFDCVDHNKLWKILREMEIPDHLTCLVRNLYAGQEKQLELDMDHPRAPAPSILYPSSNIDWRFISYMIVYMFQCHSPKSSHPLPIPQSPKDCSIHLCLFCCLAYRVIVTIFLNSIYMC